MDMRSLYRSNLYKRVLRSIYTRKIKNALRLAHIPFEEVKHLEKHIWTVAAYPPYPEDAMQKDILGGKINVALNDSLVAQNCSMVDVVPVSEVRVIFRYYIGVGALVPSGDVVQSNEYYENEDNLDEAAMSQDYESTLSGSAFGADFYDEQFYTQDLNQQV